MQNYYGKPLVKIRTLEQFNVQNIRFCVVPFFYFCYTLSEKTNEYALQQQKRSQNFKEWNELEKKDLLYEGKAKQVYGTTDEEVLWIEYIDQVTAGNGVKKDRIYGKGQLNNQITSQIFGKLAQKGITSHFIKKISKNEQLVKKVKIIPLEVVVRNYAAGSFSKRLAVPEGTQLNFPIVEFYYKEDALNDPLLTDEHVEVLEIATKSEIAQLKEFALEVNEELITLFREINIQLIDFKLEFGKTSAGEILLADEISPDTCRLWDIETNEHLDKDVYRRELGDLMPVYEEVFNRLTVHTN